MEMGHRAAGGGGFRLGIAREKASYKAYEGAYLVSTHRQAGAF